MQPEMIGVRATLKYVCIDIYTVHFNSCHSPRLFHSATCIIIIIIEYITLLTFTIKIIIDSNGIRYGSIDDSEILANSLSFVRQNSTTSNLSTFFYNVSGIHLLRQPAFSEGNIVDIRVFGYLREEDLISLIDANRDAVPLTTFTFMIRPFLYYYTSLQTRSLKWCSHFNPRASSCLA